MELKTFSVGKGVDYINEGCNTVFQNRMLLFGAIFVDVVSEVKPGACGLSKVGTFPANIEESGCTTISDETGYYVLVCFPYSNQDKCYRFLFRLSYNTHYIIYDFNAFDIYL